MLLWVCAEGVKMVLCMDVSRWLCVVCVCWGCRGGCV